MYHEQCPAQLACIRRLQWARVTWLTPGPGGVKLWRKKMLHRFGWTQAVTFDGSESEGLTLSKEVSTEK